MSTRLRKADCTAPGIRRRRAGKGFSYVDASGHRVTDAEVLDRIRSLVIPPAWTDVWICPDDRGHIQATGVDARGRKQYRYHDLWRQRRDREKFDHMVEFASCLPRLRQRVAEDLVGDEMTRERVLAAAVRLLDLGFFRIGTEGYAEENQTYGLATIHKRHVTLGPDNILEFDYVAKSGKRRIQSVVDPAVYSLVKTLKRRRGGTPELLAWRRDGKWADVRSTDINAYVKELTGGEFTAKDFRTWNATVLAAVALGVSTKASPSGRKRAVTRAVKEVAHYLGNTPAVCRSSYIDPRVIDRYLAGESVVGSLGELGADQADGDTGGSLAIHGAVEQAVLDLLLPSEELRAA